METEVVGVLVAVDDGEPLALAPGTPPRLPSGPLEIARPSLQRSTRHWIIAQTGLEPGYLEQLYTFADAARPAANHLLSVSYLGLMPTPARDASAPRGPGSARGPWVGWYQLFPWEDRRADGACVEALGPGLDLWAGRDEGRRSRADITFGRRGHAWIPELVLQRYELLYEAGMIPESPAETRQETLADGLAMAGDHRRILATGLARLRAKIEYRPVVFELMPEEFTLTALQRCVEAIEGQTVHTQNFRRTVAALDLVEETGTMTSASRGRPARLVRFRREVLQERLVSGTKLPVPRAR